MFFCHLFLFQNAEALPSAHQQCPLGTLLSPSHPFLLSGCSHLLQACWDLQSKMLFRKPSNFSVEWEMGRHFFLHGSRAAPKDKHGPGVQDGTDKAHRYVLWYWVSVRGVEQKYPQERKCWQSSEDFRTERKFSPAPVGVVPTCPLTLSCVWPLHLKHLPALSWTSVSMLGLTQTEGRCQTKVTKIWAAAFGNPVKYLQ